MSNIFSSIMTVLKLLLHLIFVFSKHLVKQLTVVVSFTSTRKHTSVICNTSQWNIV